MSRPLSHAVRRSQAADGGFTLVEIMAALLLLALGAIAVVPVLIVGSKTAHYAKLNTQAKNLTQERFERLRDLQFHVEKQNGDFVDLLDMYYTNISSTPVTRTYGTETLTGRWVGSGTPLAGEPAVPFYRVTISSIAGYPRFSQTVTTQFLQVSGVAVPASMFSTPAYNSQAEANDGPPSLLVGVTVLTKWNQGGSAKNYRAYTRIADSRGSVSSLTSQGKATLLKVTSAAPDLRALSAEVGSASADGSQTTGSSATASGVAGTANDSTAGRFEVARGVSTTPATTNSTTGPVGRNKVGDGSCGWAGFGASNVTNLSSKISLGVPQVPDNVGTGSPPSYLTSGLYANGPDSCGIFAFNNHAVSGLAAGYNPGLELTDGDPLVFMPSTGGFALQAKGTAWVDATDIVTNPHTVTSGAGASSLQRVEVFPSLPFVDGGSSRGLVNVTLNSADIRCTTSVPTGGTAVQAVAASYNVTVEYWTDTSPTNAYGAGAWVSSTFTWNGTAGTDPLAAAGLSPGNIPIYTNGATVIFLSKYISSWSIKRVLTEGSTNGVSSLDNVFSLATVPVRSPLGIPEPTSSVGVEVGHLSCAADDTR